MAILSSTGVSGFLSSAKATGKQILNKAGKLIAEYIEDWLENLGTCVRYMANRNG